MHPKTNKRWRNTKCLGPPFVLYWTLGVYFWVYFRVYFWVYFWYTSRLNSGTRHPTRKGANQKNNVKQLMRRDNVRKATKCKQQCKRIQAIREGKQGKSIDFC